MKTKTTPSMAEALRMLRDDRRRRRSGEPRRVVVQPRDYDRAANDPKTLDPESVVFWTVAVLIVVAFWLSMFGLI